MTQLTFSDAEYGAKRKRTRREIFLAEMETVVPWSRLLALIEPHYPKAGRGRRPYPLDTMLRCHLLQNWFGYSDPAMEEALYEIAPLRQFARLSLTGPMPDETTLLNFRHLLERHALAVALFDEINAYLESKGLLLRKGTIVDATIIHAPSSTKNKEGKRDPEMHSVAKGNQWYFGMRAHIGVDDESGLVHTAIGTAANCSEVTQAGNLLHGQEERAWADAGYVGADKRPEVKNPDTRWQIAIKRGNLTKRPEGEGRELVKHIEYMKASVRAKVEHPFRVVKQQFHHAKVRYRGLMKNTSQLHVLFGLSNLWMARKKVIAMAG